MSVNTITRSPMSPFSFSAASTINGLKHSCYNQNLNVAKSDKENRLPPSHHPQGSLSCRKRSAVTTFTQGQLSLSSKKQRVDSDLKAAASALTNFAALLAAKNSNNENLFPPSAKKQGTVTVNSPLITKDATASVMHNKMEAPSSFSSSTTGVMFRPGVPPTHPSSRHNHQHHPHHLYHHSHLPCYRNQNMINGNQRPMPLQQQPRMIPNPMGWMWPMVPAHPNREWPRHLQNKPTNTSSTSNNNNQDDDWTRADEERLANLEKDYKSNHQINKTKRKPQGPFKSENDTTSSLTMLLPAGVSNLEDFLDQDPNAKRRKRTTWTKEEDEVLQRIVPNVMEQQLKGCDDENKDKICWSTVSRLMPGRDSKQCRDRWLNHLDPTVANNANKPWTEEEDRKLVTFIQKHGTRWRLMQGTILPDRTELTIKNRWNSAMKRRYTRYLSRRWAVPESKILLINKRGLLAPGVNVEQMLLVARCKMSEVAYHCGEPSSSKSVIDGHEEEENENDDVDNNNNATTSKEEETTSTSNHAKMVVSENEKPTTTSENATTINSDYFSIHVVLGRIMDDSYEKDLGVVQVPINNCFAATRALIQEKVAAVKAAEGDTSSSSNDINADGDTITGSWMYSVPQMGIISSRQEIDLRPMVASLGACGKSGTPDSPFELMVVEN